jgi:hypothetical protein
LQTIKTNYPNGKKITQNACTISSLSAKWLYLVQKETRGILNVGSIVPANF